MKRKNTLRDIVRDEKRQMNPIRRKMNYTLLPVLLAVFLACVIVGIVLMTIDEEKYAIPFVIVVTGGFLPILLAVFLVNPLVRKKEAQIEADKFDFDKPYEGDFEKAEFETEWKMPGYEFEAAVFSEFDGTVEAQGIHELEGRLHDLLDEREFQIVEPETLADPDDIILVDNTEEQRLPRFRLSVTTTDKTRVSVTAKASIVFDENGMMVNGEFFPYSDISVYVQTGSHLMRANVYLLFEVADKTKTPNGHYTPALLSLRIRLDKRLVRLVEKFGLSVQNNDIYHYLLTHKKDAFLQILKYGTIRKIKK